MDMRTAVEVPTLKVTVTQGWVEKVYEHCFAVHSGNLVIVRSYYDAPNTVPRAVFHAEKVFVEHFGTHPLPESRKQHRERREDVSGEVLNLKALEERKTEHEAVPAGTTPEKQEAAMQAFEKDAIPAEEHPSEKKYLEESPKEERSSYTDPEPTSVLPMLATPSGRFATSLPEPANSSGEVSSTELTRLNEPYGAGVLGNRAERRSKSSHKKPKQLPGVALLAVVALSLSVLFRHPQY